MICRHTKFIAEVLQAAEQLLQLAETGDHEDSDDSCAVLSCVIKDCAYKIRARAALEREIHKSMGTWDEKTERFVA